MLIWIQYSISDPVKSKLVHENHTQQQSILGLQKSQQKIFYPLFYT